MSRYLLCYSNACVRFSIYTANQWLKQNTHQNEHESGFYVTQVNIGWMEGKTPVSLPAQYEV